MQAYFTGIAANLNNLGVIAQARGNLEEARRRWTDRHVAELKESMSASVFEGFIPLAQERYDIALPREVFESAAIDGASPVTSFFRLAIPMSVPALAALAIFAAGLGLNATLGFGLWGAAIVAAMSAGAAGYGVYSETRVATSPNRRQMASATCSEVPDTANAASTSSPMT